MQQGDRARTMPLSGDTEDTGIVELLSPTLQGSDTRQSILAPTDSLTPKPMCHLSLPPAPKHRSLHLRCPSKGECNYLPTCHHHQKLPLPRKQQEKEDDADLMEPHQPCRLLWLKTAHR